MTVSRTGQELRVDIKAHFGRGMVLQSHGESDRAEQSLDIALERIGKRLRRYKRRLKGHHRKERAQAKLDPINAQRYILAAPPEDAPDDDGKDDGSDDNPIVIAEESREIRILSVSDAVMHLDLSDRAVVIFRNAGNGQINVVYRRRDGNIGWIDPD